jgi:hypothetical protein
MSSILRASLLGFALMISAFAQDASMAGHYDGVIQSPDQEVKFSIDIEKAESGWSGYLSMNQGPRELPLDKFVVNGDVISFALKVPNPPAFEGKWDKETKSIKGTVTGPNGSVPFELTRTGEAKKIAATPSTPLGPELLGTWEGALEVGGRTLRLQLVLKQGSDGKAQGNMISLDQGNAEIPLSTIIQSGSKLTFDVRMVGGDYKGALNEAKTEISGDWTQGGRTLPLTFKKAAETK